MYGAETWNMKEVDRRRLDVFEMRCLRNMVAVSRLHRVRVYLLSVFVRVEVVVFLFYLRHGEAQDGSHTRHLVQLFA